MSDWPSMDGEDMMPIDDSQFEYDFGEVEEAQDEPSEDLQ